MLTVVAFQLRVLWVISLTDHEQNWTDYSLRSFDKQSTATKVCGAFDQRISLELHLTVVI